MTGIFFANSRLIDGIRDVMSDTDVDLQIFFTDNKFSNERNCLDVVAHQGFDGFIVDGVKASLLNPNLDCYRNIFAKKIPVIFIDVGSTSLDTGNEIFLDEPCHGGTYCFAAYIQSAAEFIFRWKPLVGRKFIFIDVSPKPVVNFIGLFPDPPEV